MQDCEARQPALENFVNRSSFQERGDNPFFLADCSYQSVNGRSVQVNLLPAPYPVIDEIQCTSSDTHHFRIVLSESEDFFISR